MLCPMGAATRRTTSTNTCGAKSPQRGKLEVTEQITYLLVIRRLEELHTLEKAKGRPAKVPHGPPDLHAPRGPRGRRSRRESFHRGGPGGA